MAESKRIFNQAKINRDLDARLLPPGVYRDGLNVNVGESEGGDIGAVENLKGNEEITGQGAVDGVTIGSVRDPNNDKVYWFNTSSEFDAIYEYDQSEDTITTILRDPKNRVASLPTCSPDLQARITDPRSNINNRPPTPALPSDPVGGCMDSTANNYNPLAEYSNGSCTYGSNISVTITGDGSFTNSSSPVTLTANVTNANGAFTYAWDTGETTQTISVSGSSNTITGNVTVTDSYGSATDNYSVSFTASPPATTLGLTLSNPGSQTNGASVSVTSNVTNALGSISYDWKINNVSTGNTNSSDTYTGSNTTVTKTLVITDAGRTSPNHQASASRSVAFSAAAPPTYTKTLAITDTITGGTLGTDYEYAGDVAGDQLSGTSGSGFAFSTTINVLNSSKEFAGAGNPSITNASGTFDQTNTVTTSISGTMSAITVPTFDFTGTTTDSTGANISAAGGQSYLDKNSATTINYTSTATLDSGYEWVQVPTATDNNLPSGVTMSAISGSGSTGDREVTIAGTWQATSSVSPTVTWTGGSAQVIPTRRSVSISSYGGVTTSAECASRSMPITVYFSDTSSSYTGVRNGDTLYTSATGSSTYSSGTGYKTYVADGFGQTLGTVTISNGVVSNSDTSFC